MKEFELPAIKLNDNKVEVINVVNKSLPNPVTPQKSTVGSNELLASYIAHLERLEDLENDRTIAFNDNNVSSSNDPKIDRVVHPSLTPLPNNVSINSSVWHATKLSHW